jgi:cyclopropane-fatty-acyl-phospholipid synthase
MSESTAARLRVVLGRLLRAPVPVRLRAWDGSVAGPEDAPVVVIRDRRALRRLVWQPNELGLARAYVAGDLDLDGDLYDALLRLGDFIWSDGVRATPTDVPAATPTDVPAATPTDVPADGPAGAGRVRIPRQRTGEEPAPRTTATLGAAVGELARLGAIGRPPRPPAEEVTVRGIRHSLGRDRRAVSHHYDVGNEFYRLVLGESMVYSCAYWTSDDPSYGLADAQHDKLELICRKLALRPGMRLLDVGCGWGSLALHAAREHGATVVGITLSHAQMEYARKQAAMAGLADRVDIRLQDYRQLDDPAYDAISSVGMAEHVGLGPYREYAAILHRQLRPGGRLLNHQIAALHQAPGRRRGRTFIDAYVFPDGELAPIGTTVAALEDAGLEVRDVEALREHYARTLRAWVANLESSWDQAVALTSAGRARVWRLYMAASALAFERGHIGVNQVLAVKPDPAGRSGMPPTRSWLAG